MTSLRRWAPFAATAAASAALYTVWVRWVPLLPSNLYMPLLDLGKMTGYRWSAALVYLALVVCLYGLYAVGYRLVSRDRVSWSAICGVSVLFCLELMLAYPATAVDVFGYIAQGRLLGIHGVNPFVRTPGDFSSDPILPFVAFRDEPSQYGPAWALISAVIAFVASGSLLVEILLFKVVGAVAHIGGGMLVYGIARRLTADDSRARACGYVYLWNPLLLWEMVGNAHNDGVMALCALLAIWSLVCHRTLWVLPAVVLGALVKLPVALLGPVLFIAVWRHKRAAAVEGTLLALALGVVMYRPFWVGPETLTALRRTDLFTASLGSVLRLALATRLEPAAAAAAARALSLIGFALAAVLACARALRARSDGDLLLSAYITLLAGVLLATTWFQAWYVVWPLAIGAALPEGRRHVEVGLLSLGGLLQYFVFIYLWVMGVLPAGGDLPVQSAAYVCVVGPLVLALAARALGLQYRVASMFRTR